MNPFGQPSFWGGLFSFLGSLVISSKWLMRSWFVYRQKTNLQQATLTRDLIKNLSTTVEEIKPVIVAHTQTIQQHQVMVESLERSVKGLSMLTEETREMMRTLKVQYDNFQSRMNNVTAGSGLVMDEIKAIKTEVQLLKSGNLFIRNKKETP